ncbi:pyridoxamine 5'-phosphate oxidase family protein [Streptomyces sp. L7]
MPDPFPLNVTEGSPLGDLGRRIGRTAHGTWPLSGGDGRPRGGGGELPPVPGGVSRCRSGPERSPQARRSLGHHRDRPRRGQQRSHPWPGPGGPDPTFTELTVEECRELLSTHGVGRVAVPTASGPVVVPVNYGVVDGAIVARTAPGAMPSRAAGCQVTFEIDRIDEAFGEGWSVLALGRARTVTDADDVRRLEGTRVQYVGRRPCARSGPHRRAESHRTRRITTRHGTFSEESGTDGPSPADSAGRNMV